jgi:dipeptidyl aminopeptidase/acylaminoacyl peptidase
MRLLRSAAVAATILSLPVIVSGQNRSTNKAASPAPHPGPVVHTFSQVSIAPNGRFVVWSEEVPAADDAAKAPEPTLYFADAGAPSSPPRRITAGNGKDHPTERNPVWSPDGRQIAFLSEAAKKGQRQMYVVPAAGGTARQLTNVAFDLSDLSWSPDGKQIGFLFIEHPTRIAGPTAAVPPQTGVIGEDPFEQRLAIVDVASGKIRTLSPADLYIYEYAWSRDSGSIAAIAARGSGDNNWYLAQLFVLSLETGTTKSILQPSMQIAAPAWSPDGKSIAFIGGLMSDEGAVGGEIYCVPAAGGTPRNLTPGLRASASWLTWLSSDRILFVELVDGGSGVAALDPTTGRVEPLWTAGESIAAESRNRISVAGDGKTTALVRQSFDRPPEIWVGPIGSWQPLTHANAGITPSWGKAQSLHWKSDEWTVQGWLLYPHDYQESRRYPMITIAHGGPASQYQPGFASSPLSLPAAFSRPGYFVFMPNPRGSYGQGEAFTRANVKDFGHGDLRDILSGVDEILKILPVDKNRLGLEGWSYGGYMTMWAVTQTNRFRAAVAGAGIANWQSYYGQNGIDQWVIAYFGATVYDDPAVYAKSSPINFIKQVQTPTLILVGQYDAECPVAQSYEFWHALKALGVPTEFVVYPQEGHGIKEPEHQRDIQRRMMAWFDKYLGKDESPANR